MKIPGIAQLQNIIAANSGGIFDSWTVLDHYTQLDVVTFDCFYQFGYNKKTEVLQYPIEQGSFASYNKNNTPFAIAVTLIKSGFNLPFQKKDFVEKLQDYCENPKLVDIVTPSGTYLFCTMGGLEFNHTPDESPDMIMANLTVSEVRFLIDEATEQPKTLNISSRVKQGFKQLVGI